MLAGALALLTFIALVDSSLALTIAPAVLLLTLFKCGIRPGERLFACFAQRRVTAVRPASQRRPRPALFLRPVGRVLGAAYGLRGPPAARLQLS
ncbi:hypothetical protein [Solirubrobacter deserti]|uniref:Uncharacterized protein n=1 Tax=Solirubrobacter deserti TaxID=2282478 RepID=A0ABT4RPT0_9ACTN|nr:hypothetical protein [Solirubrobacter deserti]MDA0140565.1 hypothetical protein [Solirubrobacter deserti]